MSRALTARAAVIAFLGALLSMVSSPPAHAYEGVCDRYMSMAIPYGEHELVPYRVCVFYIEGRGVRGFVDFYPEIGRPYQLAGRYFVTLQKSGSEVARSAEYVNPVVYNATSWPTTFVGLKRGVRFCTTLYERRTQTLNTQISRRCWTF